jgi:hypothetical protein
MTDREMMEREKALIARRVELQAIAAAGKDAEAELRAISAGPGPEFFAAVRAIIGTDTPDAIAVAFKTPLGADIQAAYDDLRDGRRTVKLPLNPPAGALQAHPLMIATLKAIEQHCLSATDARAVLRAQKMTIFGMARSRQS